MTDPDDRLQALFDATVRQPSQVELDRMARAAAQLPERTPARAWWARAVTWPRLAAALVGVAAVAGALAIGLRDDPSHAVPIAQTGDPIASPGIEPFDEVEEGLAIVTDDIAWSDEELDAAWLETVGSDPLAALDGEEDPLGALDLLLAFDDDDLDVLLASYERTLDG
jgi:hypothetical protein